MASRTTRKQIDDFLALKRLAFVGISLNPKAFSRGLWHELLDRRYEVFPVNPNATELDGKPCFARVQDIQPPVDGALLITPPEVTEQVVRDCHEVGIKHIWMYRAAGRGSVSASAVEFCKANGINVVAGECPYMFLEGTPFFHKIHGVVKKVTGSYPR
jgi:predicted CoA-binding protein